MTDILTGTAGLVTALAGLAGAAAAFIQAWHSWQQFQRGSAATEKDASPKSNIDSSATLSKDVPSVQEASSDDTKRQAFVHRRARRWMIVGVAFTLVAIGAAIGQAFSTKTDRVLAKDVLEGHWYGTFGDTYFEVEGNEARAIYTFRDGRILANIDNYVVDGWWTEAPSRKPPNDAGQVHFEIAKRDSKLLIYGKWSQGRGENWGNWTLEKVDEVVPGDVQEKFKDHSTFAGA
jgi:hypothetical protein